MNNGYTYIEEFLAICDFLSRSEKVPIERGYILISRQILDKILDKNAYDAVESKLRIWKRLHWIDTDPDRYTKKISRNGTRTRVVKIDLAVYHTLALLFGQRKEGKHEKKMS